ncbi:MAG TPA: YrdB family protein [Bacteroidales bacterium]
MNAIKSLNLLVSFLLELMMLCLYSYWAYHSREIVVMRYLLAVLVPVAAVVLWGIWAAPKSKRRLKNPARSVFKLALLLLSAVLCFKAGQQSWAIWFGIVTLLNAGLAFALSQDY